MVAVGDPDAIQMWSRHNASVASKDGRKRTITVTEVWQVIVEPDDFIEAALLANDLPQIRDIYVKGNQVYPHIRVTKQDPSQISPILFHVQITYEGELGPDDNNNPLDDPPDLSWGKTETDEALDEDFNGTAIVTANGEPIEGVTMKVSDLLLTIKRNYAFINLPVTYTYLHSVNSDIFAGFAPGLARLTQFSATEVYAEEYGGYWEVTAGIQFRYPFNTTPERAWWARVRNEGYYVRRREDDAIIRAFDAGNKEPTTRPVLLDTEGYALEIPEPPTAPEAVWLEFQRYAELPYASLGLLDTLGNEPA
tara:strand:- start:2896 stop:3819 length:924 start_codon:yes stop_codon:yes gene_type:complete